MPRTDPADLTLLLGVALALAFAAGVWLGRWTQRRAWRPQLRSLACRLRRADAEIDVLHRRGPTRGGRSLLDGIDPGEGG